MEEKELIHRLKQKDIKAFEEAVDQYKNYVGAIVKNRVSYILYNIL